MPARPLTQEFIATERLREIRSTHGLSFTQAAALAALERLHQRAIRNRFAVVTHKEMARPVWVAQKAMEALPCTR